MKPDKSKLIVLKKLFQDKCAVTEDGQTCFVIVWETENNQPAFKVWRVSNSEKNFTVSRKITGCCNEIRYLPETDELFLEVWGHPKGNRIEKFRI